MTAADAAVNAVAQNRTVIGAFQNRLERTQSNLMLALENTTNAESTIRDADFATEGSALTRAQILVQAGSAMLAQSNLLPQTALSFILRVRHPRRRLRDGRLCLDARANLNPGGHRDARSGELLAESRSAVDRSLTLRIMFHIQIEGGGAQRRLPRLFLKVFNAPADRLGSNVSLTRVCLLAFNKRVKDAAHLKSLPLPLLLPRDRLAAELALG